MQLYIIVFIGLSCFYQTSWLTFLPVYIEPYSLRSSRRIKCRDYTWVWFIMPILCSMMLPLSFENLVNPETVDSSVFYILERGSGYFGKDPPILCHLLSTDPVIFPELEFLANLFYFLQSYCSPKKNYFFAYQNYPWSGVSVPGYFGRILLEITFSNHGMGGEISTELSYRCAIWLTFCCYILGIIVMCESLVGSWILWSFI